MVDFFASGPIRFASSLIGSTITGSPAQVYFTTCGSQTGKPTGVVAGTFELAPDRKRWDFHHFPGLVMATTPLIRTSSELAINTMLWLRAARFRSNFRTSSNRLRVAI